MPSWERAWLFYYKSILKTNVWEIYYHTLSYDIDYYNSHLIRFLKSGHASHCQSAACKFYNKCDMFAIGANCVVTDSHRSFKYCNLIGGTKKGIDHFLNCPLSSAMTAKLGHSVGMVEISGLFISLKKKTK